MIKDKLESMMRGFPDNVKHYLMHIGVINGEQDYLNKRFILEGLCPESKACKIFAIRALDYIRDFR